LAVAVALGAVPGALHAQITFVDRGPETGTDGGSFGRGAAMVDVDGDGLLDIVAANDSMPNFFLRQRPDRTFEDATAEWGIAFDERASWGVLVADFDNDDDPDVYFVNGGFPGQPNQVMRNDLTSDGVLTDVSAASADGEYPVRNFGATALDHDLDGDLDIFLTTPNDTDSCVLLVNQGNLLFTKATLSAGLAEIGPFRHCSAGDFNNDGWPDVAVGNFDGPNLLYRNNGDGTFTDVAAAAGVQTPDDNFGLVLDDFDNDGWQDIFAPKYLLEPTGTSELFRNNGDGTFTDVTPGSGMTGQTDMGHNTGDLDADGFPDIFIGTGNPAFPDDSRLFLMTPDGTGGLLGLDYSDPSGIRAELPVAEPGECEQLDRVAARGRRLQPRRRGRPQRRDDRHRPPDPPDAARRQRLRQHRQPHAALRDRPGREHRAHRDHLAERHRPDDSRPPAGPGHRRPRDTRPVRGRRGRRRRRRHRRPAAAARRVGSEPRPRRRLRRRR
jgi:hypothetical protein